MNSKEIFVKITRLELISQDMEPPISDLFAEGGYYKAMKYYHDNPDNCTYRIMVEEGSNNHGIKSVELFSNKNETEDFVLYFDEIAKEDMIYEDLSLDEVEKMYGDLVEDLDLSTEAEKDEGFSIQAEIQDMIKGLEKMDFEELPKYTRPDDREFQRKMEYLDAKSKEIAYSIDMNYVKFMLFEIRDASPEMFLSIFNLINQYNKEI